ncbi:AraC family transcriptional regulator [Paenibacillus sp. BSR1-1]|uniref:AraC family transcriptional regulator n=1 Tax=Paenibacillus sp. BSR1-1 TaxID=3020845 RepID=UPI0025B227FA|nr:AraC family transcriptional regulator [Paenibacillus sp. BSR1-1]MDN3014694.1 AraC family transcriptional regulator [Paenibacillus sp. BSR1-1]
MDELLSKCWLIKNAFKIDVQVVDHQLQTMVHISDDSEPYIFIESRKKMYVDIQKAVEESNQYSFCFHTDSFQLSYLAVGLQEEGQFRGIFIAGPFLNERVTDQLIWNVLKENHLENSWLKPIEIFYKSLPYLGQSYLAIGDLITNLLVNPRVASQFITTKKSNEAYQPDVQPQNYDMNGFEVKLRYEAEKKFLHFIELGDKENAMKALIDFTGDFSYRVPGNPLRAKKNLSFSSNTMNRLAAAKGGVEPQYLHAISEKFALKIEAAVTMAELDTLSFNMVDEYCEAVKNFAVKGHSKVVRKALMYINLNFQEPINLQRIAEEIGFNRSYLAQKFKQEMNISLIDYLHQKRINEAVFLMEQGQLSITDIGLQVGYSSYNYFCKIFKEVKGMTASDFIKAVKK